MLGSSRELGLLVLEAELTSARSRVRAIRGVRCTRCQASATPSLTQLFATQLCARGLPNMASKNVETAFQELRDAGFMVPAVMVPVLSIDAWRYDDGWNWNQWWEIGEVPLYVCDLKPRALLAYLREAGILGAQSGGHCEIDDDGYNLVICERSNHMPVFALAYGEVCQ